MGSWEDPWLQSAVESALDDEPGMDGSEVRVDVEDSRVRLRGFVRSAGQRERALGIARSFGGGVQVEDGLLITP